MQSKSFTLVEIMIVVAIIGLLAAIAVPSFLTARETSRKNACINNLRQIDGAKEQWALANNAGGTATMAMSDLVGSSNYIKATPVCKAGGTYSLGNLATAPTCGYGNGHALP